MSKALEQLNPPILQDVLEAAKRNLAAALNCVNIGIIQSFDVSTQTASVQLALKRIKEVLSDGTVIYYTNQLLLENLPVVVLFGGGSFLSMPIAAGDNCLVLFNDRQIDQWFANGGIQAPQSFRAHSLSDGIALVGINSLQSSIADYLAAGVRLSFASNSRISLTDNEIDSIAGLFKQTGNMQVTGNLIVNGGLEVDGIVTGTGGTLNMNANITLHSGNIVSGGVLQSSNGVTKTQSPVNSITVSSGIVTAVS